MSEVADGPAERLRTVFADAGVRGWLHAAPVDQRLGEDDAVAVDPDQPVPMASLYKLPLLVAWCREVDAGRLDPTGEVRLDPAYRTPGPTGISTFADEVRLSGRDLVRMMMTVSDNAAADAVLTEVGLETVAEVLVELGLTGTVIRGGAADTQELLVAETGSSEYAEAVRALTDIDRPVRTAAYDAARSSATTPRDMTRLLGAIWRGEAASAESCAFVRRVMVAQVWRHRLASGFPHGDVVVAGKTGTLMALRHEVGVVEFPDEVPVAVAVLTRSARPELSVPSADAVIGEVGREAVTPLRRPVAE